MKIKCFECEKKERERKTKKARKIFAYKNANNAMETVRNSILKQNNNTQYIVQRERDLLLPLRKHAFIRSYLLWS